MKFFADALKEAIGDGKSAEISRESGIAKGNISRYLSGEPAAPENLEKLLGVFPSKAARHNLMVAWIRDLLPDFVAECVEIRPSAPPRLPHLSVTDEKTLTYWWKEAAKDPAVGRVLGELRRMRAGGK